MISWYDFHVMHIYLLLEVTCIYSKIPFKGDTKQKCPSSSSETKNTLTAIFELICGLVMILLLLLLNYCLQVK